MKPVQNLLSLSLFLAAAAGAAQSSDPQPPATPAAQAPRAVTLPPAPSSVRAVDVTLRIADRQGQVREVRMHVVERQRSAVRQGLEVPIAGEKGPNYKNVGLNVDITAHTPATEGWIRLQIVVEDSSVSKENASSPTFTAVRQSIETQVQEDRLTEIYRTSDPASERIASLSVLAKYVR